jgi:hypothetical protein
METTLKPKLRNSAANRRERVESGSLLTTMTRGS